MNDELAKVEAERLLLQLQDSFHVHVEEGLVRFNFSEPWMLPAFFNMMRLVNSAREKASLPQLKLPF